MNQLLRKPLVMMKVINFRNNLKPDPEFLVLQSGLITDCQQKSKDRIFWEKMILLLVNYY
jgi:hypothetical protein